MVLIISVSLMLYGSIIAFAMDGDNESIPNDAPIPTTEENENDQPEDDLLEEQISAFADDEEDPTEGEPIVEVNAAGEAVWSISNANDIDSMLAYMQREVTPCVADLHANINYPKNIEVKGHKLTIIGNGHSISGVTHFIAVDGGSITFGNADGNKLTLVGNDRRSVINDNYGLIVAENNGQLNMYDGVTVKDNKTSRGMGGAVTVNRSSSFHMYGGTIQNCGVEDAPNSVAYGGAIAVMDYSTFIMDGGTIENCYSKRSNQPNGGGGAIVVGGSNCTINGTINGGTITIRNCTAEGGLGGAIMILGPNQGTKTSISFDTTLSSSS